MREKLRYNQSSFDEVFSADGARELFHAYIGGLYSQENGPMTVSSWVFDLVASPEERRNMAINSPQYQQGSYNWPSVSPPASHSPIDNYSNYSQSGSCTASSASQQLYPGAPMYDALPRRLANSPLQQPFKTHTAYLRCLNEIVMKRRLDVQWYTEQVGYHHPPRWKMVCIGM